MDNAFKYIKENGGIDTEASYPYEARVNTNCIFPLYSIILSEGRTCEENARRHDTRREKERQTDKEMGRQHLLKDRLKVG